MFVQDIPVCCAVIRQGFDFLAVQRSASMRDPLRWEFPGGKLEAGETAFDCIHRELDEELKIQVNICGFMQTFAFLQGDKRILLMPFLCTLRGGEIKLIEHNASLWLNRAQLSSLTWCEADLGILKILDYSNLEHTGWWL